MARPRKTDTPDLAQACDLTAGAIERLACPADKTQAFLRDAKAPGLRVRVTAAGAKSFVFEAKLNRQTIRRTIGDVRAWSIEAARTEARRLAVMLDSGTDPRELERQQGADKAARAVAALETDRLAALTVGEVWAAYLQERRPFWGDLHYRDHLDKAKLGGTASASRGADKTGKTTQPGPLASLMPLKLRDLDAATVEAWAAKEGQTRPASARLAWRLLTVFLTWCAEQPEYAAVVPERNPAKTKRSREALGKPASKTDALLKEQLPAWFNAVKQIQNPVIGAYLQCLLLTGTRRRELVGLRWEDMDTVWHGLSIRDKVEGERVIPLTPYVAHLLAALPRRNEWVFSSPASANGSLAEPSIQHGRACTVAGIDGLTLHGLRRSFKSLTEWLEIPAGVVAQIMGHKPSATAEKHYTVRPLDLLRVHHERIEAWILEQAAVPLVADVEPGKLRAVAYQNRFCPS